MKLLTIHHNFIALVFSKNYILKLLQIQKGLGGSQDGQSTWWK